MGPHPDNDTERLQRSPHDIARWQKAQQQLMSGRYGHALAQYRKLIEMYDGIAQVWFELGMAAGGELEFALADTAFQKSATLARDDVSLLVLIGQQYQRLRRVDRVMQSYESAVAADPNSAHARLSLAAWFERQRRLEDAGECVEKCLAAHPQSGEALYFRAFLLHRRGQNEEAQTALRALIKSGRGDAGVKSSSRHLLGAVLDELGEYAEAIQWVGEAKKIIREHTDASKLERLYDQAARQRQALLAALTPTVIRRWREESLPDLNARRLVFLGGHPRSGTTLIEQILGAHPDVLAFDEPEAFTGEILNEVAPPQSTRGLTLDGLNALSVATRGNLRERYFKSLLREATDTPTNRVLVDKNPSLTASLPAWVRIFPHSKIIMPLRDPRDVIISCYFQNLALTSSNVNFLSLERTARHFAELTDVWLRMKELGGFDAIETRYEDVVADLAGEGKRITEFVGLPWHPSQVVYHESAQLKFVSAPTYHDVTKPVHQRAIGRWQHYEEALAPVMSQLSPYCKVLGYS